MAGILYPEDEIRGALTPATVNPLLYRQVEMARAANPRPDPFPQLARSWDQYPLSDLAKQFPGPAQGATLEDIQRAASDLAMNFGFLGMVGRVRPREFFRGTNPGSTERIKTGANEWDSYLFASSNLDSAKMYGSSIEKILAKPEAKILYEGSQEFRSVAKGLKPREMSMLNWADEVARRAKSAGYDAVHFERQGDIGTAIFNPGAFIRGE